MMGRLFNKFVRKVISMVEKKHNMLAQDLNNSEKIDAKIDPKIVSLAREVAIEGTILLKNENNTLPLKADDTVSVFGRCAFDYFDCGYGSGGDVMKPYSINLIDGLRNHNVKLNEELVNKYNDWRAKPKNVVDPGFWGHWPFSYPEMKFSDNEIAKESAESSVAIVVIGRAAGEDRENKLKPGSFYLTKDEENLLDQVTKYFKRSIVVLNTGNIIDMSFVEKYQVKALVLAYQGGMESGNALATILTGEVSPSGRLTDTVAIDYNDYPSSADFGVKEFNNYKEDIYVGYRYFETFKKDRVLYPFGYGLSYTDFKISIAKTKIKEFEVSIDYVIQNVGDVKSKEVVELYLSKPNGKLKNPRLELVGYYKSNVINPKDKEKATFNLDLRDFASFDDTGATGHKNCYILEDGVYDLYLGKSVRDNEKIFTIRYDKPYVVKEVEEIMGVVNPFLRMINNNQQIAYEETPIKSEYLKERIEKSLPKSIPMTVDQGHTLMDVKTGKISIEQFVSELSLDDLDVLSRGEGKMDSPLGTKGNGGAFGGITESLRKKGIPPVIVSDGPSGLRVKYTSTLLPIGALIASTYNRELVEELFIEEAKESKDRKIDVILGPGMNIHRNPLCGRNFEYYSEDPYLSGTIASSVVKGLDNFGIFACPKHYLANSQETDRWHNDSRVSVRALREIYLKNFSYMVKDAKPHFIMTSYNKVNSIWSHYNFDAVRYLRNECGFTGIFMTDWWMRYIASPEYPLLQGNAYRVRSGVNILMPGNITQMSDNVGDSLMENYDKGGITLGELQRNAIYILSNIMDMNVFTEFYNKEEKR